MSPLGKHEWTQVNKFVCKSFYSNVLPVHLLEMLRGTRGDKLSERYILKYYDMVLVH